jgi:hypothetical protein
MRIAIETAGPDPVRTRETVEQAKPFGKMKHDG